MITPEQLKAKAERLYPQAARAWLAGDESFFPRTIPASKSLRGLDVAQAIDAVRRLREGSKEVVGYGYTIEWDERRSRRFGHNAFPRRIVVESREDLLKWIGRQAEFHKWTAAVERLRAEFGQGLESWFPRNVDVLVRHLPQLDDLIAVVRFFLACPRPNRFIRELPIDVDTKFVERHQGILRQWLDRLLPPEAIRADERQFERRFGLRDKEPFVIVRCLDAAVQQRLGVPWPEFALPLSTLATLISDPWDNATVLIVENRTTLRTVPPMIGGLAVEGRGSAVAELRDLAWLERMNVVYWGDLDIEGLAILSNLRAMFPHVRSLLMDMDTLTQYRPLCVTGTGRAMDVPARLNESERAAFVRCQEENLRLEQERIPQAAVESRMLECGNVYRISR